MDGPTKLTGKKILPVLEFQDRTGATQYMPESNNIINKVLKMVGAVVRRGMIWLDLVPFWVDDNNARGVICD